MQSPGGTRHHTDKIRLTSNRDMTMNAKINTYSDWNRNPSQQQAVFLPIAWALVRRFCYLMAQKGDPTL